MKRSPVLFTSVEADVHIEEPMKYLCPFRQLLELALLQRLRERVEQGSHVPALKVLVTWFAPLAEDIRDVAVGTNAEVRGPDYEILGD